MFANKRKLSDNRKWQRLCAGIIKHLHLIIIFVMLLLVFAIFNVSKPLSRASLNNEKNAPFTKQWDCVINDVPTGKITLPYNADAPAGAHIILKNHIPNQLIKGAAILLRTSQQDAVVFVDDEKIYSSFGLVKSTGLPSAAYHVVRLPENCANAEITVLLSSPYANYSGIINQIYLGTKASNLFFLVHENGFRFVVGFLVLCMGILLIIMFLFAKGYENRTATIYLGAFFVSAGYWVIVESNLAQFFCPYPTAITNTSIFALTMFPVFAGLYYYKSYGKSFKHFGKYIIGAVTLASIVLAIITCVKPTFSLQALPFYIVLMGIFVVLIFVCIVIDCARSGNIFTTPVYGIAAFGICCLLELTFFLKHMKNYDQSVFLTLGLFIFCTIMVIDSVQNLAKVYKTAGKVDTLSILAYSDSLTGLKNRTAFLETLSTLDPSSEKFISIAMFDVNDLKLVNDTRGHLIGDALLIHSAKTIKSFLRQKDTVYRIGGDEFVSIILHNRPLDEPALDRRIITALQKENSKPLSYHLSIAYGYSTFDPSIDDTLFETLDRADENMYSCKKLQKSLT